MTRSVLVYVDDKACAFPAFHRVLRSGGRISLYEPINHRYIELNRDTLFGYDATPIQDVKLERRKFVGRSGTGPIAVG